MPSTKAAKRRTETFKVFDAIERWGNSLPHPFTLFILFSIAALVLSWVASSIGVSVVHPVTGKRIVAVNLLDGQGIQNIITKAVSNFTSFAPLGTVLVAMIGVGVAERSGLFSTVLKGLVAAAPAWLITTVVVFAGINSTIAADAGYVILIPLGAAIFAGAGKNPIVGLAAAFAGVSAGFSADIFLTPIDPLLAGLTQEAARLYDSTYTVPVTANYYIMAAAAFLLTGVGVWVTDRVVAPRFAPTTPNEAVFFNKLRPEEKRGLIASGIAVAGEILLLMLLTVPSNALLRDSKGTLDPLFSGMVTLMSIGFLIPGIVYGIVAGTIKNDRELGRMIEETMSTMGSYIALAFAASQFIAYFGWSNLGLILAITGADFLKATGLSGIPLIVLFIFVCGLIDLFLASASAKWAVIGPVFVPMLMILGYSPELTQAAYRIGDSFTNVITPLMPYMPLVIAFAQKYQPEIGLGTILVTMLPYSVAFAIGWTLLLVLWVAFGIPLGPGVSLTYPAGS
jgi:aminobenzoyl-glutamate transport protein